MRRIVGNGLLAHRVVFPLVASSSSLHLPFTSTQMVIASLITASRAFGHASRLTLNSHHHTAAGSSHHQHSAVEADPEAEQAHTAAPHHRVNKSEAPVGNEERPITVRDHKGHFVHIDRVTKFESIPELPGWLLAGLNTLAFPGTTDIQSVTIPPLLQGQDVIGLAPTGSGKTIAFAVPALKMFDRSPQGHPTILVLAPTRELVQQTAKVFQSLSNGHVRVCEAYGGSPRETQAMRLQRGCDVLVACPGRLKDFLESGVVSLEHLRFLVFDEADRLLDMGFKPQLDDIMSYTDRNAPRQTMMWSATWPESVQHLASEYLHPERYMIRAGAEGKGGQVNHNIKQHIHFASDNIEKIEKLATMIQDGTIQEDGCKMMIFVERQLDTEEVANRLVRRLGIRGSFVSVIHGGMAQAKRDFVMSRFKNNQCRILVATDVASRGLDFPDVTVVVNFMAPKEIDSYCHRIGRTGRAGRKGEAHTFVDGSNVPLAHALVPYLERCGSEIPEKLREMASSFRHGGGSRFGGGGGRGGFRGRGSFGRGGGGGFRSHRGGGGGGGGMRRNQDDGFGVSWGQNMDSFDDGGAFSTHRRGDDDGGYGGYQPSRGHHHRGGHSSSRGGHRDPADILDM